MIRRASLPAGLSATPVGDSRSGYIPLRAAAARPPDLTCIQPPLLLQAPTFAILLLLLLRPDAVTHCRRRRLRRRGLTLCLAWSASAPDLLSTAPAAADPTSTHIASLELHLYFSPFFLAPAVCVHHAARLPRRPSAIAAHAHR